MQAILMAGGKGTRLRPYTAVLPKPLVPLGDSSIIELILEQLQRQGFDRITISVGYKAELIMAIIGDGRKFGVKVDYNIEDRPLGTIGALADINDLEDNFVVMNGDLCTNMRFRALLDYHVASGSKATVSVYQRKEKIELGVLELDEGGVFVANFHEKPVYDFLVSMGVNAFHRSIVDLIPRGEYFGFDNLMSKMLDQSIPIRTYQFSGFWRDIGRPDDYDKVLLEYEKDPLAFMAKET
jgi:NDP-mannose synthase